MAGAVALEIEALQLDGEAVSSVSARAFEAAVEASGARARAIDRASERVRAIIGRRT
jgi:hypothetical protein